MKSDYRGDMLELQSSVSGYFVSFLMFLEKSVSDRTWLRVSNTNHIVTKLCLCVCVCVFVQESASL